jgi:hypothetical protein
MCYFNFGTVTLRSNKLRSQREETGEVCLTILSIAEILQVYGKSAWSFDGMVMKSTKIGPRNVGFFVIQPPDAAASPRIFY